MRDTDAGRLDHDRRYDHAVGPMQFLPSTWAVVAVDGDGDGRRNVQDVNDAALGSAVYLCAGSEDLATRRGARAALFRYNHSASYVATVLAIARGLQTSGLFAAVPSRTVAYVPPAPPQASRPTVTRRPPTHRRSWSPTRCRRPLRPAHRRAVRPRSRRPTRRRAPAVAESQLVAESRLVARAEPDPDGPPELHRTADPAPDGAADVGHAHPVGADRDADLAGPVDLADRRARPCRDPRPAPAGGSPT